VLTNYTAQTVQWGSGPPLVLIPGLAGGIGLVSPLAACLADRFQVTSYQLRGEDDCFALRRRFGLQDLIDDLAELLDARCLERPILFGVSFGGILALELAAQFPSRLAALILQGIDVRFERTLLRQIAGHVLSGYPLPHNSPFVNQFFNLLFGGRLKNRALVEFVTQQAWQTDQSVMAHRFRLAERIELSHQLHRIAVPTLLLSGERDVLVSPNGLKELESGIRQSRLVRLSGAGHLSFVTEPERSAEQVLRFAREKGLFRW
jgi:pimeloyl-ACP methyl ester carboxylesterase